jgi:UDP-N-acetyl-2-amino-2-deoxyglucuronate dehydrogenase
MNFAIIGVSGYIAPRHLKAIQDTHNHVIAAFDPNDSVGILDQYDLNTRFFTEYERFDRYLEKLRRSDPTNAVNYVTICSPNYLHDAHCRLAMRTGADVICEKPLVVNPWNLDALAEIEAETHRTINTVLQLRVHPKLIELHDKIAFERGNHRYDVDLTYVTARGNWYHTSWKGDVQKSGGIATNIGIHFFDLLLWLFGGMGECRMYYADHKRMSGFLELEHARVRWFLSVDAEDLPFVAQPGIKTTYRSIKVNGQEIEFSDGFTNLHTRVYERTLQGVGFRISDIRPATELAYHIRTTPVIALDDMAHPFLKGK